MDRSSRRRKKKMRRRLKSSLGICDEAELIELTDCDEKFQMRNGYLLRKSMARQF